VVVVCGRKSFVSRELFMGGGSGPSLVSEGRSNQSMTPPLRSGHCCKVTYHSSRSSNGKLYDESTPVNSRYNFPEVKVSPIQTFLPVQNDHLSSGDGLYSEDVHSRYSDFHRSNRPRRRHAGIGAHLSSQAKQVIPIQFDLICDHTVRIALYQ